jgi:hypothetical protein
MNSLRALFTDELFWCGFVGAAGVELVSLYRAVRSGNPPKRIGSVGFWALWLIVSVLGGWLAARVVTVEPALIATITGATVTLAFQKFSKQFPP